MQRPSHSSPFRSYPTSALNAWLNSDVYSLLQTAFLLFVVVGKVWIALLEIAVSLFLVEEDP